MGPPSMNAVGPAILAAHAECGGLESCNIMEGAQKSGAFTKLNAYQHIPTLEDGDFSLGESNAILRFLALKYEPELYPVAEPEACGMVDFSIDAFVSEVYSHQAASTSAYNAAMAKWGKTFL